MWGRGADSLGSGLVGPLIHSLQAHSALDLGLSLLAVYPRAGLVRQLSDFNTISSDNATFSPQRNAEEHSNKTKER